MTSRKAIRVAVCGPSDVDAEKAMIRTVVSEINQVWGEFLGIQVEAVEWRTHAWPGVDDDAQSRINKTVLSEYEIFVAAMWARFGSPTVRADSGTEEEFQAAFARAKKKPNDVSVFMYFNHANVDPYKVNPTQLARVCGFRQELLDQKVLIWDYNGLQEFESFIRAHLSREIQRRLANTLVPYDPRREAARSPAAA